VAYQERLEEPNSSTAERRAAPGESKSTTNGTGGAPAPAPPAPPARPPDAAAAGPVEGRPLPTTKGMGEEGRHPHRRADLPPGQGHRPVVEPVVSLDEARRRRYTGGGQCRERVDGIRAQIRNLEQAQRDRLVKAAQLTAIAIVFITFVLQKRHAVNVHFLSSA